MASKVLDERKRRILKVITDDYIASAEPVGSRTIARKYNLGLSPATIRNEMADLEEEGYLEQPHTSAGRIPSDRGYRYYVDALMQMRRLQPEEIAAIQREMDARERAISGIIHQAARVLAQFTHFPSLISPPDRRKAIFKHVRLVKLNDRDVLILMVADTGEVMHKIVTCEEKIGEAELERLSHLFHERLRDRPLGDVGAALEKEIRAKMIVGEKLFHQAMEALIESSRLEPVEQVVLDGASQILDQPEFAGREQFRPLLNLLEQERSLYRLLTETCGCERLKVAIGQENKNQAVRDCSVVTATYEVHGRPVGVIGILGPTRMDYSKVLAVVEFMAEHLSTILNDLAGD